MESENHRPILEDVVRESLTAYSNFEEADELLALVEAWAQRRIGIAGGVPVFDMEDDRATGGFPIDPIRPNQPDQHTCTEETKQ